MGTLGNAARYRVAFEFNREVSRSKQIFPLRMILSSSGTVR